MILRLSIEIVTSKVNSLFIVASGYKFLYCHNVVDAFYLVLHAEYYLHSGKSYGSREYFPIRLVLYTIVYLLPLFTKRAVYVCVCMCVRVISL